MAQVAVSVAVAGGGRGNVDESVEDVSGLPAEVAQQVYEKLPSGWVRATRTVKPRRGGVVSRNDIANAIEWIIRFVGADSKNLDPDGTKPWSLASFLLALDQFSRTPQAQALPLPGWIKSECFQKLIATVRRDLQDAGLQLANKVPQWIQEFMNCLLADDPESRALVAQVGSRLGISIDPEKVGKCLFSAVMQYITTKDPWGAVGSFFSCMLKSSGGGGGAQVEHESVSRC